MNKISQQEDINPLWGPDDGGATAVQSPEIGGPKDITELRLDNLEERVKDIEDLFFSSTAKERQQQKLSGVFNKLVVFADYLDQNEKYAEADRITKAMQRVAFDTGVDVPGQEEYYQEQSHQSEIIPENERVAYLKKLEEKYMWVADRMPHNSPENWDDEDKNNIFTKLKKCAHGLKILWVAETVKKRDIFWLSKQLDEIRYDIMRLSHQKADQLEQ